MNYAQRIVYQPEPPDEIYDQMKSLLIEMGYKITMDEKTPDPVFSKNPVIIGKKEKHSIMVTFKREQAETAIEIHVSQIGEKVSTKILEQIRDEVTEKFKQKMKK
jgi:hypothetical protein